jgi:hypothetical protein
MANFYKGEFIKGSVSLGGAVTTPLKRDTNMRTICKCGCNKEFTYSQNGSCHTREFFDVYHFRNYRKRVAWSSAH